MTAPLNISSDDAAFFQASTSGPDNDFDSDSEDTEDPVSRGASAIGQLDMFVPAPRKQRHLTRGGTGQPQAKVNLTKGANLIPH
jgi:hypothetical protein